MRFGSPLSIYLFFFFAVLAARLKFAFVGAPLAPGFLIFSPEPAAIRFLLAWMFAYNPRLAITSSCCAVLTFANISSDNQLAYHQS